MVRKVDGIWTKQIGFASQLKVSRGVDGHTAFDGEYFSVAGQRGVGVFHQQVLENSQVLGDVEASIDFVISL